MKPLCQWEELVQQNCLLSYERCGDRSWGKVQVGTAWPPWIRSPWLLPFPPGIAHGHLGYISKAQRVSALCGFTPLRQFPQMPNGGAQTYLPRMLEIIKN